jgi:hypothetical protein
LVEVERIAVAGFPAVQAVFKIPQTPTGMTYEAAITIPFRDCSFVIKWQCPEFGMTGARDATVFALVSPPFDEATGEPISWARDLSVATLMGPAPRVFATLMGPPFSPGSWGHPRGE